jgi:hypothetical protein
MMRTNYSRSQGLTYGVKQKIGTKGKILHLLIGKPYGF